MDAGFWHSRWQDGRIGFHQDRPTPLMLKHWPSLGVQRGARVFVPLCGKSLDLAWFASQGLRVLGAELSQHAVEQFFAEHGLTPDVEDSRYGRHFRAGDIEIICGDAFALDEDALRDCHAVFDRAALIALPPTMRESYVRDLYSRLPATCRGLVITLEYSQQEKAGPPFSVEEDELRALYSRDWQVELLERRDILDSQQSFVDEGVTALSTAVYRIDRR